MSPSSLKLVVEHDVRLDILGCLHGEPLTITQLSARIGKPTRTAAYHVKLLESRDLVEKTDDGEDEAALYSATLDKHPAWVVEAVEDHRRVN